MITNNKEKHIQAAEIKESLFLSVYCKILQEMHRCSLVSGLVRCLLLIFISYLRSSQARDRSFVPAFFLEEHLTFYKFTASS